MKPYHLIKQFPTKFALRSSAGGSLLYEIPQAGSLHYETLQAGSLHYEPLVH